MLHDPFLVSLSSEDRRHIWIGLTPEFTAPSLNLFECTAYRAAPQHHAAYDVVWCYEIPLDQQGWRIFVDGAVTLLASKGTFVLRYTQNYFITIPAVKNYLFRKYGLNTTLLYESHAGGFITNVFAIERSLLNLQTEKTWSFGILTQNTKVETVAKFCESVRKYGGDKHQIIICAPKQHADYEPFHVEYITKPYSDVYAEISLKKNDIIALTRYQNIMLIHDRYVLNENFFSGFEEYGYDFEYATVLQHHESGKLYPGLCAIQDFNQLIWGELYHPRNDKEQWTLNYINGGLVIAKKHVLETFPFNPMIFHGQAEDVELARVMKNAGIIARENPFSSVVTNAPDSVTGCFVDKFQTDYYRSLHLWIHGFYPRDYVAKSFVDRIFLSWMQHAHNTYRFRYFHGRSWMKIVGDFMKKSSKLRKR